MAKRSANDSIQTTREKAWIGDAVLSLFARKWILETRGKMDGEMLTRFTSNAFLASFGNPTNVEAEIGETYESQGSEAAEAWIEKTLLPVFRKQEAKRKIGRR